MGGERTGAATVVSAPVKSHDKRRARVAKARMFRAVRRGLIAAGMCVLAGGAAWAGLREPPAPAEPPVPPTIEVNQPPLQPVMQPGPSVETLHRRSTARLHLYPRSW